DVPCDVLVVGGGTGGVAAALAAARRGCSVCLVEETDWLGGQLTSQGVAALDEHLHIETFGGTASYYRFRDALRDHYRTWASAAGAGPDFNRQLLGDKIGIRTPYSRRIFEGSHRQSRQRHDLSTRQSCGRYGRKRLHNFCGRGVTGRRRGMALPSQDRP